MRQTALPQPSSRRRRRKKGGKAPTRTGKRWEREFAKECNREFTRLGSELWAKRVIGSSAFSHRDGTPCGDPEETGDVQIRRKRGPILLYVECKYRDPLKTAGPFSIADMDRLRPLRWGLACRQARNKSWLISLWNIDWDSLVGRCLGAVSYGSMGRATRAVKFTEVLHEIEFTYSLPLGWGAAVYMTVKQFCALLDAVYREEPKMVVQETPA